MLTVPLYYPPIELKWILAAVLVFVGAVADRIDPAIRDVFASPLGFFAVSVFALLVFEYGFPPIAFALFFALLMMWSSSQVAGGADAAKPAEGFDSDNLTVVTRPKKWFVERVLKEEPVAILERDVETYPVQGASAQSNTTAGTT
jgi:hypothetical protein